MIILTFAQRGFDVERVPCSTSGETNALIRADRVVTSLEFLTRVQVQLTFVDIWNTKYSRHDYHAIRILNE